jgi:peptidoglycan-associated lipoprotein
MKSVAKLLSLALISAAVVFTGCTKKPLRPSPEATVVAPTANLAPETVNMNPDAPALAPRDGVIEDEFTIKGLLKPVYFGYDKSAIEQAERAKLEEAAKYLKEHPEHRLLLEGHCDWRGTAEYNLGLGERRAGAAKKFLTSQSVDLKKLETTSKGSLEAAKSGTDEQMGKDRRVELIVLKK